MMSRFIIDFNFVFFAISVHEPLNTMDMDRNVI